MIFPNPSAEPKTDSDQGHCVTQLSPSQKEILARPSLFAKYILQMPLYPQQEQIVDALARPGQITVRTCNESGKTTRLIASLILWHMVAFPRRSGSGGVITTSGSWNQLKNQLVPALRASAHHEGFNEFQFNAETIAWRGFPQWVGFSTNNPGAAEGFHGTPESPLLVIVDEAKSVPDNIFTAIEDRCNPQRIGFFSSPGGADGRFYRSHAEASGFQKFKIPASECPHISKQSIDRRIARHGINSSLVQSMIFAEFMDCVEDALLTLGDIDRCVQNPPALSGLDRRCFCDFAAGGNENVIAFRQGNLVKIIDAWTDRDTMSAVGRFITRFTELQRRMGLRPDEIEGDADGIGKPMIDRLHEAGWPIGYFHGGSKPRFDSHYSNRISEVWFMGADRIRSGSIVIEPDEELRAQLINRKSRYNSDGKISLEPKEEMKRRGVGSPDRADALMGAMSPGVQPYVPFNLVQSHREQERSDWTNYRSGDDAYIVPGAWAG